MVVLVCLLVSANAEWASGQAARDPVRIPGCISLRLDSTPMRSPGCLCVLKQLPLIKSTAVTIFFYVAWS